jgi:hypothetical protein
MAKPSKWAWRAGEMYRTAPRGKVCRHRIAELGLEMMMAGESFNIIRRRKPDPFTTSNNWEGHTWIEYDNNGKKEILEPTWGYPQTDRYTAGTTKIEIGKGKIYDEIGFLTNIKNMYRELGQKLPKNYYKVLSEKLEESIRKNFPQKDNVFIESYVNKHIQKTKEVMGQL